MIEWNDIKEKLPPDLPGYCLGFTGKLYAVYGIDLEYTEKSSEKKLRFFNLGAAVWDYDTRKFKCKKLKITHWAKLNLPGCVDSYVDEKKQVNPE